MLLHAQIFKESISVADWEPTTSYMCEEDLNSACTRLIAKVIVSGALKPMAEEPESTASGNMSEQEKSECATFRKNDMTFHACQLLSKEANPTKKPLYLVCVTVIDPQKKASWQASRNSSHDDDDEEDPEVEYEEEAKLKFFDFQNALRADILNPAEDDENGGTL